MMTINLRKIITATMATGMLLGVAGGVNASFVQQSPITANAATRRSHYSYRSYHHRATKNGKVISDYRYTSRHGKRRGKKAKRIAQPKVAANLMLNNRQVNKLSKDSFDALQFVPTRAGRRALKHNAKLLDAHHVAYGVYMANTGNTSRNAKAMQSLAPNAYFYIDAQYNGSGNISGKARGFAKSLKQFKKPLIYYAGTVSASQHMNDGVREMFNYQLTSGHYKAGSPVWRFAQNGMNDHIGRAIIQHTLNNTMPLEFQATTHGIRPMDSATVAALYQAARNNKDQASRFAESAAMQQWQHNYEKHQYLGPSKNISTVKKSLNKHSMKYYQRKASHRFTRLGASLGSKKSAKKAPKKKKSSAYYTNQQMTNAYTSMRVSLNHGYNGYWKDHEGCEATSMDMGLHLLGLNRHKKLYNLLKAIPRRRNPEYGYTASPFGHTSGTSLYPEELTRLAKHYGAHHSRILADDAYYTGSKKHHPYYLAHTGDGHSFGKTKGRLTTHSYDRGHLTNYASKKMIMQALSEGHPIVIEADHDFKNKSGDHVILLWGYHNNRFYWCDPNDSPRSIPNHGGSVSWGTVISTMNNPKRGPRAVILAR